MGDLKTKYFISLLKIGISLIILFILSIAVVYFFNYKRLPMDGFWKARGTLVKRMEFVAANASPEYATERLKTLPPSQFNGSFFRFDDMLGEAQPVDGFDKYVPAGDSAGEIVTFDFNNSSEPGLQPKNGNTKVEVHDGILHVHHQSKDFLVNSKPLSIPRDAVGSIVIRLKTDKGRRMRIGWHANEEYENTWQNKFEIDIIADSKFHEYKIDVSKVLMRGLSSSDNLRKFLLMPSNAEKAEVEIDYIKFVSQIGGYQQYGLGKSYKMISGEMRPTIFMCPPQALEYTVKVPENSPTLEFGTGILVNNEPVTFEVILNSGLDQYTLYRKQLAENNVWVDIEISLDEWRNKEIKISFRVFGGNKNVGFWSNPCVNSRIEKPFNIVILLEDALRSDHLSVYDYRRDTSPYKKALMEKTGIIFKRVVSQSTKTRPSIPSIMTSLYPSATGVMGWGDILKDNYLTIAEILRGQGFVTASIVQNGNAGQYVNLQQGFCHLFDREYFGKTTEGIIGDKLFEWIERHKNRNFFLYIHILDPHCNYNPPPGYRGWYHEVRNQETNPKIVKYISYLDPDWLDNPTMETRRALYDGEILHNDALIKKLLNKLKELEIYQDTLIVFTSDHGEYLGDHGWWTHHPPSYAQVLNVPLMMVFERRFSQAQTITQRVQLIDIMPTILDLAGLDTEQFLLHGESLLNLIEGGNQSYWNERLVASLEPMSIKQRREDPFICGSLFYKEWHLISSRKLQGPRGWRFLPKSFKFRVFNTRKDPSEYSLFDLFIIDYYTSHKYAKAITELQNLNIKTRHEFFGSAIKDETLTMDPDTLEQLRKLGYIR